MSSDPYDISDAYRTTQPAEAIGVVSGLREDLRRVGSYQRWIIVSLLVQVTMLVAYGIAVLLLPPGPGPALDLTRLVTFTIGAIALVCGVVSVFLLSVTVHERKWVGYTLAILVLIPCVGYLVLVAINSKAIQVLRSNGIEVGLFGAKGVSLA